VPGVVQLDADDIGVSLQIDGQQQRRPRPLAAARHRRPVQVRRLDCARVVRLTGVVFDVGDC